MEKNFGHSGWLFVLYTSINSTDIQKRDLCILG